LAAKRGDWVEVTREVLAPGERAPNLPEDTAEVPYTLRVRGVALADAEEGAAVRVRTAAGREVEGRLVAVNPSFDHDFGDCVPELVRTRLELLRLARGGGDRA
jgi:hypothetical protein